MSTATRRAVSADQTGLFSLVDASEIIPAEHTEAELNHAGKALVTKLCSLRRELTELQKEYFFDDIEALIITIRAKSELTENQQRERILYSVERQQAGTETEIAEDCRLAINTVKRLVSDLIEEGTLYRVSRYIPGSDRKWYLIKSNRSHIPEVTDNVVHLPESMFSPDRHEAAA